MKRSVRTAGAWVDAHAAGLAIGVCALSVLLGGVLIHALSGLDEVPSWWADADAINPGDARVIARAEHIENAITTQLTAVRDPDDPRWAAAVTGEQANAWLAARLRDTVRAQLGEDAWPGGVERVRVAIVGGRLIVGARVRHRSGSSVIWSRVRLSLDEHHDLWVTLSALRVGTTPIPDWLLSAMDTERLTRSRYRLGPGTLGLGDGRSARLIALRVVNDRLEVVMETRADPQ